MKRYVIYLDCFEGAGYYTGLVYTSTDVQVGVHPYKYRAKVFDDKNKAYEQAKQLKQRFSCIKKYLV